MTAIVVAGCSGLGTAASPSPTLFHDTALAAVSAQLQAERAMRFAVGGPHHVVGTAPDGVELDLVGADPVAEVVLSVPLDNPRAAERTARAYLPYVADATGLPEIALAAAVTDALHGWAGGVGLRKRATVDGRTVRVESSGPPDYLLVVVTAP